MGKREITRQRIIKTSYEIFNTYGYSKTTMEDLSKALGMSTKTIYQYFSSKYEILKVVGETHNKTLVDSINQILNNKQLYVIRVKKLLILIGKETGKYSEILMKDLQKNVPDVWSDYQMAWETPIKEILKSIVEEGIKLEFIKKDTPVDIVIEIYSSAIKSLIDPKVLSKLPYSFDNVLIQGLKVLFSGVLTNDGIKAINSI